MTIRVCWHINLHNGPLEDPTTTWNQVECSSRLLIFSLSSNSEQVLTKAQACGSYQSQVITKKLTEVDSDE